MTVAFIQVAECCPMCGAETHQRYDGFSGPFSQERLGKYVHYQWRECDYCGWKSERDEITTTWTSSCEDGDTLIYVPPAQHSLTMGKK